MNVLVFGASKTHELTNSEIWRRDKEKATESFDSIALVPPTELFSNSFMDDLEEIWKLRAYIPDPTTPPHLYRNSDAEDVD